MPIQLHIQKMKREADVIKKNEKSANDYLTQTKLNFGWKNVKEYDIIRDSDCVLVFKGKVYCNDNLV